MWKRFSLRSKFIFGAVALVLLTGSALALFQWLEMRSTLEQEMQKRGITIARHFAAAAVTPILSDNIYSLQQLINDYQKTDVDVRYVFILNERREVVAHSFGTTVPMELLRAVLAAETAGKHIALLTLHGIGVYDISAPLQPSQLGSVHIGLTEKSLRLNVRNALLNMFPLIAVILLVCIIAAVIVATAVTRPIMLLVNGVRQVSRGELDSMIDISRGDEIGLLADSFNLMTETLRQTTVSREFTDNLVNTMNDMLLVIAPDGVIQGTNRAFCELLGYNREELIGSSMINFAHLGQPCCFLPAFENALQGRVDSGIEISGRTKAGHLIPLLVSVSVMTDEHGAPRAVVCAAKDISQLKRAQGELRQKQEELERLNSNLEEMIVVRTGELADLNKELRSEVTERRRTEEDLRLARDAADTANLTKTAFLANMSHEMRTPLNAIIGSAEHLGETEQTEDQRRCLEMIEQAGYSLLYLVNDLIDLSRIEAGRFELVEREFSLNELLENCSRMLEGGAARKGISMTLKIGVLPAGNVIGDPMRLQQVIVNLAGNAIKFTERGGVTLSAHTTDRFGSIISVAFSVRDTGIGIEPDKIGIIFESFSQADPSITRRYGGSGLGLAISKKLVETMGGAIQVESVPGCGSTFSFVLPFRCEVVEPAPAPMISSGTLCDTGSDSADPASDRIPILLVDDAQENRALIRLQLSREPVRIDEASSGHRAIELFEQREYALVLMDIQMPLLDGYETTHILREIEARTGRRRTPVVALTAHVDESDIRRCIEAGCDEHIAKPFKKKVLLDCIKRHTEGVCTDENPAG